MATVGITWEIWCSNRETGDLRKNLETPGKTGRLSRSAFHHQNFTFTQPLLLELPVEQPDFKAVIITGGKV